MSVSLKKVITLIIISLMMISFSPCTVLADEETSDTQDEPALEILAVVSAQGTQFTNRNLWNCTPALSDDVSDYTFTRSNKGVGYMNLIAYPKDPDIQQVNVYATTPTLSSYIGKTVAEFTGKVKLSADPDGRSYKNSEKKYPFYEFRAADDVLTCTVRVELIGESTTRNYNILCSGMGSVDPLSEIQSGFDTVLETLTDVSTFISPAKVLVETAKPLYKARMEAATDAMEACKIANEFNTLVCQAKAIEDEYTVLNDKVTDAEDALAESEAKNQELENAKAEAEEALKQANEEIASKDGVISAARNYISELEESTEKITEDLNKANSDLSDALDKLDNTEKELEKAKTDNKIQKIAKVKAVSAKAAKKKVTVKWKKVTGATGYVVYRSLKKSKDYTEVKTIKKVGTVKFTDKKVKKGKKYFYKIRAYKTVSGNQMFGAYSKVLKTKKVK